ncbi:histidinol-phosphatase HisJ family protein [Ruminiclostridium herbifermentans]|uniref:Histidinol-phosphatase n=1 Tax=Ruminiclostridium herbifermentans TaxID=2488810 RepID=A0A4U7JM84_9FIRM|nr:histidinol-phosphatase HisJ family protein [Ruminiclostridium herbifermentans]QNU65535.1 histidinol-phosphatase HisJ family protein [Ruminiclostridium herbifermentans]
MHDNHIHSNFSGDSDMEANSACQKALEMGLSGLVFTDHVDYDYPDFDESFLINLDQYFNYFKQLQSNWKDKLDIRIGIEMGFQPHVIDEINKTINNYPFDFIINSVHIIDHLDPYTGQYFIGKTQRQAYERYLQEILSSIVSYDNYDIIGHIGYVARYCKVEDKPLRYNDYAELLDQILRAVIEKGKGIELNTSGIRSDLHCSIPGLDTFKRYFELGGELITIGSDAHRTEHVGHSFKEAAEYLKEIGFKYVAHFEARNPIFEKL